MAGNASGEYFQRIPDVLYRAYAEGLAGKRRLHYTYGTIEYFDMEQEPQIKRSVGGWAEPDEEEPGGWTVGENAGLLYDIDDSNGPVIVAFTTTKVMPGVSVEFTANGKCSEASTGG